MIMSFEAFNKDKDEEVKNNLKSTINPETNEEESVKKALQAIISPKNKPEEKKRSVTFSITESQLKKMNQEARKNGFKNKSEMLASFIDAL